MDFCHVKRGPVARSPAIVSDARAIRPATHRSDDDRQPFNLSPESTCSMRRAVGMASAAEVFVALLKTPLARHFKASQRQKKKHVSPKVRQLIACPRTPPMFSHLPIHFPHHLPELTSHPTPLPPGL